MKYVLIRITILTVFLVFSFIYMSCHTTDSNIDNVSIQYVTKSISAIEKYHVNLNTKIYIPTASDLDPKSSDDFNPNRFMEVKSKVFGESGRKMKIQTIMRSPELGHETELTHIFDGTWLWVQSKVIKHPNMKTSQPMISSMKIHIPSVSPDPVNEPFNTIYGISGVGLSMYKDLPGTFMKLIKVYSFLNVINSIDKKEIIFSGTRKIIKQNSVNGEDKKELNEYMDKRTKFCKLWVSEDSGLINAYSIGMSEKKQTMITKIEYVSINEQLPDDVFFYAPPKGIVVRDVTASVLKQKGIKDNNGG